MAFKFDKYKQRFPGEIFYYGNASHGFFDTLIWLQENRPKARPNIVMPVYIPAKLYRYVLAAGYEPVFYDINRNCGFDPEEVARFIDDQTQAVLAVHYFGIPCPVQKLKTFTKAAGVFLIEDCVHTLNSRDDESLLGTMGDCAMFSARKMLQLPSGGFLILNNPGHCRGEFQPSYKKRVRSIYSGYYLLTSRTKYVYYNLTKGYDPLKLAWIPGTGYIDFSEEQQVTTKKMSYLTKKYLTTIDIEKVTNRRRFNFNYLLSHVKMMEFLQPVYPEKFYLESKTANGKKFQLNEGITPYSFPLLTPSGTRSVLRQLLCDVGVGCGAGWPETPFHHDEFTYTKMLSDRLLEIPIHQGITVHQLNRVVDCLKGYELKIKSELLLGKQKNESPTIVNA